MKTRRYRSDARLFLIVAAVWLWAPGAAGGPLFFKPDLPDFYQHQKSGSDPAKPFKQPDLAPADPPIVVDPVTGMEQIKPGFTNGNWWENSGGWCCVAAFVNSFHFLDRNGFPGLFNGDPAKPWQQRMAFAIEDLAIDFLGLIPNGDPDGAGPRMRSDKGGPRKSIPEHLAKHGYGPDKLEFSEYFWDEAAGKVKQVTPAGIVDAPFATMFDVYHAELLRSEDVVVRMEILTAAEQARFNVLARKFRDGTITVAELLELRGLLAIVEHVWWGISFHVVTGAGVDRDKAQRMLWFADPDNTFRGSGWGHPYLDTDALPVPMDPMTNAAERAKYYEEAMFEADGRTFKTGPYADPDGAGPRRAAAIARIFTVSPVPEPSTLLLFGSGLAALLGLGRGGHEQ